MSLRDRILRLIARGDVAEGRPDHLVEFATVEPYEAPILHEVLAQNGITSHGSEALNPGTWINKVTLRVARRDLDAATGVLRAHRDLGSRDT